MKKSIIESLKKKGISLYDNSLENLKSFAASVNFGKLSKEEIKTFLDMTEVPIKSVLGAFESSLEADKNITKEVAEVINKMVDTAKIFIQEDSTIDDKKIIIDLILDLAERIERIHESTQSHQRSKLKIVTTGLVAIVGIAALAITGGKVNILKK